MERLTPDWILKQLLQRMPVGYWHIVDSGAPFEPILQGVMGLSIEQFNALLLKTNVCFYYQLEL